MQWLIAHPRVEPEQSTIPIAKYKGDPKAYLVLNLMDAFPELGSIWAGARQ